jgi:hypothetical protein
MSFVLVGILLGLGWIAAPLVVAVIRGVLRVFLAIPVLIVIAFAVVIRPMMRALAACAFPAIGLVLLVLINRRFPGTLLVVFVCATVGSAWGPEIRTVFHHIQTRLRRMIQTAGPTSS